MKTFTLTCMIMLQRLASHGIFWNIENRASYLIVLIKVLIGKLTVGRFHVVHSKKKKKKCLNHVWWIYLSSFFHLSSYGLKIFTPTILTSHINYIFPKFMIYDPFYLMGLVIPVNFVRTIIAMAYNGILWILTLLQRRLS